MFLFGISVHVVFSLQNASENDGSRFVQSLPINGFNSLIMQQTVGRVDDRDTFFYIYHLLQN